ncbi:MAG: SDR family NAD(P)-dependent oxidoreductase [Eubacteriales bacterium]|nr:SDR family NAD(P)-dependent oxidoreductase [Eubacteriales bacterium]
MIDWIEQTGGQNSVATRLAPVIRSLLKETDYPLIRYIPVGETAAAASFAVDATTASSFVDLIGQLRAAKPTDRPVTSVMVNGIGTFIARPADTKSQGKRLHGKIVLVTGAAQGFGEGIARELAAAGAHLVIADLNLDQAQVVADSLNNEFGESAARALKVDVGSEESVQALMETIALELGGLDLLVSNAGVLRAGGLEEMTLANFDFVTKINYTAFFLVTKYGSRMMKQQAAFDPDFSADIIQINSKSGLEGSNKNFAYAGGKFGGIGLVQSFAKELVDDRIKVNAICPGNYYEGPLWSDPDRGLFVQYLKAGKVPGAKTVQDVYDFYVAKVPMRRGCSPRDVTKAILYCVEQDYETGQAIPVTGGQNMLK